MRAKLLRGIPLVALGLLSGCESALLDPYHNVPYGIVSYGNAPITAETVRQQRVAQAQCIKWAQETNPSRERMIAVFAANGVLFGFLGGFTGQAAAAKIVSAPVTFANAAAGGAYYSIAAGLVNAGSGNIYYGVLVHSDVKWCLTASAQGFHFIAPSDAEKLERGEIREISVSQVPQAVQNGAQNAGAIPPHPPAP